MKHQHIHVEARTDKTISSKSKREIAMIEEMHRKRAFRKFRTHSMKLELLANLGRISKIFFYNAQTAIAFFSWRSPLFFFVYRIDLIFI